MAKRRFREVENPERRIEKEGDFYTQNDREEIEGQEYEDDFDELMDLDDDERDFDDLSSDEKKFDKRMNDFRASNQGKPVSAHQAFVNELSGNGRHHTYVPNAKQVKVTSREEQTTQREDAEQEY